MIALPTGPVAVVDEGQGIPLVCVHGVPGRHTDFRWLAPALAPSVRVIRLDLPGFGATPWSTRPDGRPEAQAEVVTAVVEALGIDAAVVLGHSYGGTVAVAAACQAPDRFVGLALLASIGPREHPALAAFRARRLTSAALRIGPLRRLALPRIRALYLRAGFPSSLTDDELVNTMHCVADLGIDRHRARLAALRVPALVAWTDDDPLVPATISQELSWAVPAGPRIAFADGGHILQKTKAVELGESLHAWLPQLIQDPSPPASDG